MAAAAIRNLPGANREIELNLGGKSAKVKMGDLHIATRRALQKQKEKVKQMQQSGASPEEMALAQQQLNELQRLNDLTSPPFDQTEAEIAEIHKIAATEYQNNPTFQEALEPMLGSHEQAAINDLANNQGLEANETFVADVYALAGGAGDDPYSSADPYADAYADPYGDPSPAEATPATSQATSFAKSLDLDGGIDSESGAAALAEFFNNASNGNQILPELAQDQTQPVMAQTLKL